MTGDNQDGDERLKEEFGANPTAEELDREQRAALKETSGYIRRPYEPEVMFTGHVTPLGDHELEDLFSRYHPHMKDNRRIAHAVILWREAKEKALYLLKWWAPAALLTAEELSQASYYDSDLDFRVIERGLAGGAARAREQLAKTSLSLRACWRSSKRTTRGACASSRMKPGQPRPWPGRPRSVPRPGTETHNHAWSMHARDREFALPPRR